MPIPPTKSATQAPVKKSLRSNWKRNVIGIVVSMCCIAFITWHINFNEVRTAIVHFQWQFVVVGVVSLAFGYLMRIARWCIMLRAGGADVSVKVCVAPFLGSIALNNVLPARIGDVVRALVFPAAINVKKITATGSLVMERLVDLLTLLACFAIGLALAPATHAPEWMAGTAYTLTIVGVITLLCLFLFSGDLANYCSAWSDRIGNRDSKLLRILQVAQNLLVSFDAMSRVPVLIALFGLSVLVWVGEAGLYWAVLYGFGLHYGYETAVVVMAIATLSTLAPSSPGYIGPFHLAAYGAISMLGGSPAQAAGFAVIAHLAVWLPTTVAGAVAILVTPRLFSGTLSPATNGASPVSNSTDKMI